MTLSTNNVNAIGIQGTAPINSAVKLEVFFYQFLVVVIRLKVCLIT